LPRGNLGHSIDIASHTVAATGGPRSLATAGKPALMDQLKIQVAEPGLAQGEEELLEQSAAQGEARSRAVGQTRSSPMPARSGRVEKGGS
jgi:hypothetical protein